MERTTVTVTVCVSQAHRSVVGRVKSKPAPSMTDTVQETLSAKDHAPLARSISYTRLPSEATARTIDDVPLQALGIQKTLHLTLAITDGTPRLEHALLIPGAIVLK